ncbi:hypothetical protein IFT64_02210 [Oxalobacteraceae sp. CFBP 8753]|nr:hypothetical protein [Oxalobacteraceae sp. CFBP 8753]
MSTPITKIQFLSDRDSQHPIFYCHSADEGHDPMLNVTRAGTEVVISSVDCLFKVKKNPQKKNRVDIYMPKSSANNLGRELVLATPSIQPRTWYVSNANPHQNAGGRMALPDIIWSKYAKAIRVDAYVASGTNLSKQSAYVNIDLETPHETFIKMNSEEIHIGIALEWPTGTHDADKTQPFNVPENELQRGTQEQNPIYKVTGGFAMRLDCQVAAGLGQLLIGVV